MNNIHPINDKTISRSDKETRLGQHAKVLWFTGLSGSGKSTLAIALERKIFDLGYQVVVLDGDNIRSGINNNLGFTTEDRKENIRRIAEIAKLFLENGIICIVSFISPTRMVRDQAKNIIGENDFVEVFIDTPLAVCEERDVKGLYKKARAGEIKDFTGIDSPYEAPINPQVHLETANASIKESSEILFVKMVRFIKWL